MQFLIVVCPHKNNIIRSDSKKSEPADVKLRNPQFSNWYQRGENYVTQRFLLQPN